MSNRRAALVTGAASGIGRAIAERLVKDGWEVLGADLNAASGPIPGVEVDLTTRAGNREAVDAAVQRFGRLDAVVANAGYQHVAPVVDFPEDHWDRLLALMLTSPFLLAKYGWEALKARVSADGSLRGDTELTSRRECGVKPRGGNDS